MSDANIDQKVIAWANNSLFGSHNYFLSLTGGAPDEQHLARAIEELKELSRKRYAEIERLKDQRERHLSTMGALAMDRDADRRLLDDAATALKATEERALAAESRIATLTGKTETSNDS